MTKSRAFMIATSLFATTTWGAVTPPVAALRSDSDVRLYRSAGKASLLLKMIALSSARQDRAFFEEKVRAVGNQNLPQIIRETADGQPRFRLPDYELIVQAVPKEGSVEIQINGKKWTPPTPLTAQAVWAELEKEVSSKSGSTPFDIIHSVFAPDSNEQAPVLGTVAAYASMSFAVRSTCQSLAASTPSAVIALCTPLWGWPVMAWNWSEAMATGPDARTFLAGQATGERYCAFTRPESPELKEFQSSTGRGTYTFTRIQKKVDGTTVEARLEGEDQGEVHRFDSKGIWVSYEPAKGRKASLANDEREILQRWLAEESWKKLCTWVKTPFLEVEAALFDCENSRKSVPEIAGGVSQMNVWFETLVRNLNQRPFTTTAGYGNLLSTNCDRQPAGSACHERLSALKSCVKQLAIDIGQKAVAGGVKISSKGSKEIRVNHDGWIESDKLQIEAIQPR